MGRNSKNTPLNNISGVGKTPPLSAQELKPLFGAFFF